MSIPQRDAISVKHGVLIRCDPVLKVYIQHDLQTARNGGAANRLFGAQYDSLDSEHLFFGGLPSRVDAADVDAQLKDMVREWMGKNTYAALDDGSEDEKAGRVDEEGGE